MPTPQMADARAFRAATRTSRSTAGTDVDGRSHTDRARGLAAPRVPAGPRFSARKPGSSHAARRSLRSLGSRDPALLLEQNLSEAAIREFKLLSLAHFEEVAAFMTERAPALSRSAAVTLLHDAVAAIAGLYPGTHPSAAAARALADPALCSLRRDFARELERFLGALARDAVRPRA